MRPRASGRLAAWVWHLRGQTPRVACMYLEHGSYTPAEPQQTRGLPRSGTSVHARLGTRGLSEAWAGLPPETPDPPDTPTAAHHIRGVGAVQERAIVIMWPMARLVSRTLRYAPQAATTSWQPLQPQILHSQQHWHGTCWWNMHACVHCKLGKQLPELIVAARELAGTPAWRD